MIIYPFKCILNMSLRMRWTGHVACVGYMKDPCILIGNHEAKLSLGRPWRGWEDNIKIDLK
jgi:hypothetical protein